ncbi:MAG: rod shape-determining protein MreD [Selenomonadaceae bacterium]|nr:rod shape-determining protein MreD [Selenomonadaceae bacterium]
MNVILSWAVLIILMYAAQTSLLPYIGYNGVSANLMLLLTVSTAFLRGYRHGVLMGLITGILQDFTTGSFFGCSIFSYMLIGLFFGKFSDRIFKEQLLFPVLSAPLAAAMYFFIVTGLLFLIGYKIDFLHMIHTILQPLIIYQVAFSWIVHKIAYDFHKLTVKHGIFRS